jgi:hypothetical protein
LENAMVSLRVFPTRVEFTSLRGDLLGGKVHGTGKLAQGDKPTYVFEGELEKLGGAAVCELMALRCSGGTIDGRGKVELSGFTDSDLAASAKGTLHFEWRNGAFEENPAAEIQIPKALTHFDRWTADATIDNNAVELAPSDAQQGTRKVGMSATVTFANPPVVAFAGPKPVQSAKR